jgi:tryptophan-rich sensory protein
LGLHSNIFWLEKSWIGKKEEEMFLIRTSSNLAFFLKKATFEIGLLWANVAACAYFFYPINKTASYIMLPYITWITLASSITFTIWRMNKDNNTKKN